MHACMHTYIQPYIHTTIHTYNHTYILDYLSRRFLYVACVHVYTHWDTKTCIPKYTYQGPLPRTTPPERELKPSLQDHWRQQQTGASLRYLHHGSWDQDPLGECM